MSEEVTLDQIQKLGNTLNDHYVAKAQLEQRLANTQQRIDTIEQRDLPDLMDQVGMETITTQDGNTISLKTFINSSIKDQETAFQWLKDHGSDGIIKNEIKIAMPRGDNEAAEALSTKLTEEGIPHTLKPTIHHATLKSTVKEILEGELADDFPKEAFGVSEFRKVIFK